MGCSHFHMARENVILYNEYQKSGISKIQEDIWRDEEMNLAIKEVMENPYEIENWYKHSRIVEIACSLKTKEAIQKALITTECLSVHANTKSSIIIAETIIGRGTQQSRSGLIYLAYDHHSKEFANKFYERSLFFLERSVMDDENRLLRVKKQLIELKKELELEIDDIK